MKTKQATPAPAGELYVSTLFRGRRRFVERSCDSWLILSARHGVLEPSQVVAPYDETLTSARAGQRRRWAALVLAQLDALVGSLGERSWEIHAGAAYRDFGLVDALLAAGAVVEIPAGGLRHGEQLAFYSHRH